MVVKNSKDLIEKGLKLKILLYGLPGTGKSLWSAQAPNPGILAVETGWGKGVLSSAFLGVDYVEPTKLADFEEIFSGKIFADKETIILDSISYAAKTLIKDAALKLPRQRGDSLKRQIGIPELDDYGTMGEMTRRLLDTLMKVDKNIIVLATEKYKESEDNPGETKIGADLPGASFEGAPAMFDLVMRLRVVNKLRNPMDAKSRYTERVLVTQPDGKGSIAKCRLNLGGKPILNAEEIYDMDKGIGTFNDIHKRITDALMPKGA